MLQIMARRSSVTHDTFSHELLHAFRSVRFHEGDWEPQLDIIRNAAMLIENSALPVASLTRSLRIETRRSHTCAAVLAEALEMWAAPCVLGSDNSGEFTGAAFTSILQQYGVSHWRTTPHTPQQNGKMERFW
jgi:transposase InsO family protein